MKIIERYLDAVSKHLPRKNQSDIREELRSAIYDELDDKSEALGRKLTDEEQREFLKKMGHPLKVAGSYSPRRYLIGPSLYPAFIYSMKVAASIVIGLHVILGLISVISSKRWYLFIPDVFSESISTFIVVFAVMTFVFAIMEYSGHKLEWLEKWDPKQLESPKPSPEINQGETVFIIVFTVIALLWWNGVFRLPFDVHEEGQQIQVVLASGWDGFFWPINILLGVSLVTRCLYLLNRQWTIKKLLIEVILDTASIVILFSLICLGKLVEIGSQNEKIIETEGFINLGMMILLAIILIICTFDLLNHSKRLYQLMRNGNSTESSA